MEPCQQLLTLSFMVWQSGHSEMPSKEFSKNIGNGPTKDTRSRSECRNEIAKIYIPYVQFCSSGRKAGHFWHSHLEILVLFGLLVLAFGSSPPHAQKLCSQTEEMDQGSSSFNGIPTQWKIKWQSSDVKNVSQLFSLRGTILKFLP